MITLASFNIINNYTHMLLHWEFTEDSVVPQNTTIDIYRSLSPGNPNSLQDFTCISSGQTIDTDYCDYTITRLSDLNWYYKLKITDGDVLTSIPAFVKGYTEDKVVKTVLKRKSLSLNKFTARPYILLKRRKWGTHCNKCWDSTLFRATNANCPVCYGTGWVGGYFTPIHFSGMQNASPKYNQILMYGEWKPSDSLLSTLNNPLISPQDVVVDDKGKRWIVIQVRPLEKLGYVFEQQAQLALIANDDAIYSVPIN